MVDGRAGAAQITLQVAPRLTKLAGAQSSIGGLKGANVAKAAGVLARGILLARACNGG